MDEDKSGKQTKRQVHRLDNLGVSSISLLDRLAIDIGFLVLNRHNPHDEEVGMTREKIEDEEVV